MANGKYVAEWVPRKGGVKMTKIIFMFVTAIYSLNVMAMDDISRDDIEHTLEIIQKNIVVGFSWVDLPINQILLLKHKKSICAIQFNSFKRLNDSEEATTFKSSAETLMASYSKYEFEEGYHNMELDNVTFHELVSEATYGIGRLTFGGGDKKIECGDGDFYWEFPTAVFLSRGNKDLSVYPLLINDFANLEKPPSAIKWIGYEEGRAKKIINILNMNN